MISHFPLAASVTTTATADPRISNSSYFEQCRSSVRACQTDPDDAFDETPPRIYCNIELGALGSIVSVIIF